MLKVYHVLYGEKKAKPREQKYQRNSFGHHLQLQQKCDFSIAGVLSCIPLFAESNRNSLFLAFQLLSDKIPADRSSCIGQITYNSETTDDLMQLQRKKGLLLKTRLKFNPAILKLNRECFTVPLQDIKQQSL